MFKEFVNLQTAPQRTDVVIIAPTLDVKQCLYAQQVGVCNGCRIEFTIHNFEIDHIVPRAKGGGDYYENYQLLCGNCNRIKGDRPMDYLCQKIKVREQMLASISFGE